MAPIRASLLSLFLLASFLIGVPTQILIVRFLPRLSDRLPLWFCRTILRLLNVNVEVAGALAGNGPVLLVANHVSWIDVLALGSITPVCFLAKSEVASWPLLSAFAQVQGTVFVNRARRRSIPHVNRQMAERMAEGRLPLLFPEGTTIGTPLLGRFFTSHFAATRDLLRKHPHFGNVAVQPIALAYSSPLAAWIGDDDLVSHLWRTLKGPPLRCRVAAGTPIVCTVESDRKHVAREARDKIVALLQTASARFAAEEYAMERLATGSTVPSG